MFVHVTSICSFPEVKDLDSKKWAEFDNKLLTVHDDSFSWLVDGSVDFLLTDPPFNIARDTNFHTYEKNTINSYRFDKGKGWDSSSPEEFRNLMNSWSVEFFRVLRNGGSFAVFCADEYLSDFIRSMRSAGLKPRRTITWRKPNSVPVNRKYMMMSACEYIICGVKGTNGAFNVDYSDPHRRIGLVEAVQIADKCAVAVEAAIRERLTESIAGVSNENVRALVNQVLLETSLHVAERASRQVGDDGNVSLCIPNFVSFNSKVGKRLHPTEKPTNLLKYLIALFSNPGDLILDPFSGSASTGEAALQTNRRTILLERDDEFFSLGLARIRDLSQVGSRTLFGD